MRQQRIISESRPSYRIYVSVTLLCALISIGLPASESEVDNESTDSFEELTYPATFFCVQGLRGGVQIMGFRGCSRVLEYHQKIDKKDCVKAEVVKTLDDMSPGLAIRAINQKPLDVASLVILHYETAPYEYLRVELSDVIIEAVKIDSEDDEIVEETIVLSPNRLVFNIIPSENYRRPGFTGGV